ncbi:MAG: hypothetical protein ACNS60_14290 [Candidatus Cyclobacteriaceae bacterium M2_1C_046]
MDNKEINKMGGDLLVPMTDNDPNGNPVYHPMIGKGTLWGGIIGGILIGFVFWMIADGAWAVVGLGQLSSGGRGPAAFVGFCIGSGIGGLIGAVAGIIFMIKTKD